MRGADVLVEMLIKQGVEVVFGVPGDTSMAFHDALRLRQKEIRHILCRDERHAAYAADAYARVTGRVGVVEVPSGGGALYVVPGLSEADCSNIPLVCLASEISMSSAETNALTDCNQQRLFAAVTKWNAGVSSPELLPHLVRKAFRKAAAGAQGATALTLPENVLRGEYAGSEANLVITPRTQGCSAFRNEPSPEDIAGIISLINQARRPLVLFGGGIHLAGAYEEALAFAERYQLPVITSVDGKGSIQEYHELAMGTVGANGGSAQANEIGREADLLLVIGSKADNVTTFGRQLVSPTAKVAQVDISEEYIGNNLNITLPVMADAKATLAALVKAWDGTDYGARHRQWKAWAREKFTEKRRYIEEANGQTTEQVCISYFFEQLSEATGPDTIFTGEAGTPTPYLASYLRQKKSGRLTILPRGHGALGYAIGSALGAAVGRPDHQVISLFGDGSFGMSMGDLETARRLSLPILFVNLQNDCYGWIKTIQRLYYKSNYYGVDFSGIDAVKIAEGFYLPARGIVNNAQVKDTLSWALAETKKGSPVFLNVKIQSIEEYVPPVCQWEKDSRLPEDQRKKLVY